MGTILNYASVKQPLRNLLFICAGLSAFNSVLVLFVFKSLNFVMILQQFVWLTFGSAVVLYVLNRSRPIVTFIAFGAHVALAVALYLRSQDWVSYCQHCFETTVPVTRSYLEMSVIVLVLFGYATLALIVSSWQGWFFTAAAVLVFVFQALVLLLELGASGYWYGSANTAELASFFWNFNVREYSIAVFAVASIGLIMKSDLGSLIKRKL
jgi:hypothetical protein